MKSRSLVLAGALAVAGLLLFLAWQLLHDPLRHEPDAPRPPTIGSATDERIPSPPAEDLSSADREPERAPASAVEVVPAIPAPKEAPTAPRQASLRIRGRVLDMRGEPLAGVPVGSDASATKILARSDALGVFDVEVDRAARRLIAISDEWVTVRDDLVLESNRDREHYVIVAPLVTVSGSVVDSAGRGLEGARVEVDIPIEAFIVFPFALDSTSVRTFVATAASEGRFVLRVAPAVEKARLVSSLKGFTPDQRAMPLQSISDLRIELGDRKETRSSLEGVVVHIDGVPAVGAKVLLADHEAEADPHGRFTLAVDRVQPETPLVAVKAGFQPALVPEYGRLLAAVDYHPQPVRLVLGPAALAIAGHVLEADGSPGRRWVVTLLDGTAVSEGRIPVVTAEKLTAGGALQVLTKEDGAFRLAGLRDRDYRIQAYGPKGVMIQSAPMAAGKEDVVLQAPAEAVAERISGRVTAHDGQPLGSVVVTVALVTARSASGSQWQHLSSTTTRPDGTFELSGVPRRFVQLHLGGDPIMPMTFDLEGVDLARPIEIVTTRRCHFRFEGDAGDEGPTELAVLDAEGREIEIWTIQANMTMSSERADLSGGRSAVLSVSEDGRRLVLYRGGKMLSIRPLKLVPGEIVVVRPE